jgi:hypothetical protein
LQQPQLAGRCSSDNSPCDFSESDATVCPSGGTCQTGQGQPKYGDYNGNACAVGHFYTVWASATPPTGITPSTNIDLYFAIRNTVQPIAKCKDQTVGTDPGVCSASNVSVDNGSIDPDGDTSTLKQTPAGPYSKGTTGVTLTNHRPESADQFMYGQNHSQRS